MDGKTYQALAMRTKDKKAIEKLIAKIYSTNDGVDMGLLIEASLGLSGEVGEVNDILKKWIYHDKEIDWVHVEKELGDICWYIAGMCEAMGKTINDVLEQNIDKLEKRYPDGFDVERANNRDADDL